MERVTSQLFLMMNLETLEVNQWQDPPTLSYKQKMYYIVYFIY